jgi:IclR family transcriptional regulator, KDG regulon repressor
MKSVDKVLDVLEVFLNGKEEVSIAELAEISGLHSSVVHRICSTLVQRGYLYQRHKRGNYSPGIIFLQFQNVNVFAQKIKETALPYMTELNNIACESVTLAVWNGSTAVEVADVITDHILRAAAKIGEILPPYCTSVGKLFLAYKPDKIIRETLHSKELTTYTEYTITDLKQILKEFASIRQEGVAFDDQEYELGLRSVAAPVKDTKGDIIAAIGVIGPTVRVSRLRLSELVPSVKNCALEISQALINKVE